MAIGRTAEAMQEKPASRSFWPMSHFLSTAKLVLSTISKRWSPLLGSGSGQVSDGSVGVKILPMLAWKIREPSLL